MRHTDTLTRTSLLRLLLLVMGLLAALYLAGCSGSIIPAYTGGGIPPGEPDIGGIVLSEAVGQADAAAQATTPVVGAEVVLFRGAHEVGRATTGPEGHFSFERPATGSYRARVTPPAGSGLQEATRQFRHQFRQQTFLRIVLQRQ